MFITAMAANPLAVNLAADALGSTISWGTWALAGETLITFGTYKQCNWGDDHDLLRAVTAYCKRPQRTREAI